MPVARAVRRPLMFAVLPLLALSAAPVAAYDPSEYRVPQVSAETGPYSVQILADGIGQTQELPTDSAILNPNADWTLSAWVKPSIAREGTSVIAAIGNPSTENVRAIVLSDGRLGYWSGGTRISTGSAKVPVDRWTHVAAVKRGGKVTLYADGKAVGSADAPSTTVAPVLSIAPADAAIGDVAHFGGQIVGLRIAPTALAAKAVRAEAAQQPDVMVAQLTKPGVGWEWQETQWRGLFQPQPAWQLPKSSVPPSKPVAKPLGDRPKLTQLADNRWQIGDWRLIAAPDVKQDGAALSQTGYDDGKWYAATVPGTVLTTLVDRGVYPDPAYGLNNMAIPESLSRQDYWYRATFTVPQGASDKKFLVFKGINYAAEVWVNGRSVGDIKGAFIRGQFDVTGLLKDGENAVAVHIIRPPHPGIPHEESIAGGAGLNGGNLAIDGPTFVATEGWDWIPGVRDRNMGLWQPVELQTTGTLRIGDPHIVTDLPLPRTDVANVTVTLPVQNLSDTAQSATVNAAFGEVNVSKTVEVAPRGSANVVFTPEEFAALKVADPKLWWPNGYGPQNLYTLHVTLAGNGAPSDMKNVQFGMREMSYGLSLFDSKGVLRRVAVDPTDSPEKLIDVRHEAIKQTPQGWVESLTAAGEHSPAVKDIPQEMALPHLTLYVNGVKIAARGGNWGMDDFMKRVSRDRLEPYFKLHKQANINIIRNWVGQNTEDTFYDLADEYGMLITNDFWASTQNFQMEPEDPQLFLKNARDVISRYRNHPSIALWFGRNEGVPQPILNEGLDDLVHELDGTRWFTGSSNVVNLQGSGPYNYRPPVGYFTDLASGFSVETGTPSLNTLEAIKAMVPEGERWPLSDTIAYHDWHFDGNGDVKTFMDALDVKFGPGKSLEDFTRKAQMMNIVNYKAIFEGMAAHLWTKNSGRMLWMTQPAWPSNHWQIYSHDYDTSGAYYGVKRALEPVHAQMNLPDYGLAVVNTTREDADGLTLTVKVVGLDNSLLLSRSEKVDATANQTTTLKPLALQPILDAQGVALVDLTLSKGDGTVVSRNFYWQGKDDASLRKMDSMAAQLVRLSVAPGAGKTLSVTLTNQGTIPALAAKMVLVDAKGDRVLPAYYDDNYISLLPGESRTVAIDYGDAPNAPAAITLRGWNVVESKTPVGAQ